MYTADVLTFESSVEMVTEIMKTGYEYWDKEPSVSTIINEIVNCGESLECNNHELKDILAVDQVCLIVNSDFDERRDTDYTVAIIGKITENEFEVFYSKAGVLEVVRFNKQGIEMNKLDKPRRIRIVSDTRIIDIIHTERTE